MVYWPKSGMFEYSVHIEDAREIDAREHVPGRECKKRKA